MYIGEIAAVLTALCWSVNSILFSDAGRKIGSQSVNHLRLWGALLLLIFIQVIAFNRLIPDISSIGFLFLAVSGVIGFFIGDALLFESYVLIGARMGMLMMTAVPVFSVVLAWIFLSEKLGLWQLAAIGLTILSIAFVVAEKRNGDSQTRNLARGVFFGLGGAMGQAIGLLFSKRGMMEGIHPISANLIRVLAATLVMTVYFLIRKRFFSDFLKLKQAGIFPRIVGGAILGPVIGVILSLVAILYAPMGIAATLMAISPVLLIPLSRIIYKEHISLRTIIWTCVAIAGAGWLFFLK
jgi:drug/metabolite transporter (DMT)-like permease